MNVKLLRQFGPRLLTPYGSQGHLRFESRRVVPAWSSAHRFSCSAAILAAVRQKLHLSNLFKNPEPALGGRPFDIIVIGGGTFGAAIAEHLWFRQTQAGGGLRTLVVEAGLFTLPE